MKKSILLALTLISATAFIIYTCSSSGGKSNSLGTVQQQNSGGDLSTNSSATKTLLDATSDGGTMTFQNMGDTGWYPSLRDPSVGPCDYYNGTPSCFGTPMKCCKTKQVFANDSLSPWNEELIMSLRGPMIVQQIAVYQPSDPYSAVWQQTSFWDSKTPATLTGIVFVGDVKSTTGFDGIIGNKCIATVSTNKPFPCGPGSVPYCAASSTTQYYGWSGSKMFVLLAYMPHMSSTDIPAARHCNTTTTDNWYDAPWIGLSVGELVRADCAGQWGPCHCYARDQVNAGAVGDGCGQFNVFEIINDQGQYANLDVFSSNFFGYPYKGSWGPGCVSCSVAGMDPKVDLISTSTKTEAVTGAVGAFPTMPGAAFRRPATGYRFIVILLDVKTRQIQLAFIHPANVPSTVSAVLPGLPAQIARTTVDAMLTLRLPGPNSVGVIR
ncbi:MAG TPA: DUF2403 domain-containing protein [Chitinivibrionales bacterium]|nr:DUF2403 domain-containing protein [Chitinivibrionales bacterium]